MKKLILAVVLFAGLASVSKASDVVYSGYLVNGVLTSTQAFVLDMNQLKIDQVSVQLNYSSASPAALTLSDGRPSTGTITVTSLSGLTTAYASNYITVLSTQGMINQQLIFNGFPIDLNNVIRSNTATTAAALATMLGSGYSGVLVATNNTTGTVVYTTAAVVGTGANAWTLVSSSPTAISVNKGTFTGGIDNAVLTIAGIPLQSNSAWYPGGTTTTAATAIAAAINANGTINKIIAASSSGNVVYATATIAGYGTNYELASSTPAALGVSAANMVNGLDSNFVLNYSTMQAAGLGSDPLDFTASPYRNPINSIIKANGFANGLAVLFSTSAGSTAPSPLVSGTTYYVSNRTADYFTLSTTQLNAMAGTNITFSTQSRLGGGTMTLSPLTISGTFGLKVQESNDGVNYVNAYYAIEYSSGIAATASYATPWAPVTNLWNLANVFTRYLRFYFEAPAVNTGGINTQVYIHGKKSSAGSY